MKSKIGVAATLGILAAGVLAPEAFAQCGTGVMIKFDNDGFAYETSYNNATYMSSPGSQLTVVGIITLFCAPFTDLNPADPNKEYTFIWDGLTSAGTVSSPYGSSGTKYDTDYVGGGFRIYEGSPRNAPTAATLPANPPNATVPVNFTDGTLILQGALSGFHTAITRSSLGNYSGSFRSDYACTGGTLYNRVGEGTSLLSGLWCAAGTGNGRCSMPAGYSAHPNGKWDTPATTATSPTTWGTIKQLYR